MDIRPLLTRPDPSVRRASLALRLMIALPSPLGFGFFAFGAFEQLKKNLPEAEIFTAYHE